MAKKQGSTEWSVKKVNPNKGYNWSWKRIDGKVFLFAGHFNTPASAQREARKYYPSPKYLTRVIQAHPASGWKYALYYYDTEKKRKKRKRNPSWW